MVVFDIEKLIMDVFSPKPGENILILIDLPHDDIAINPKWSKRIALANDWHAKLSKIAKNHGFAMLPLATYESTGGHNKPLPDICQINNETKKIEEAISQCDIILAITEFSATAHLITLTQKYKFRGASMPGLIREMENTALSADYSKVAKRCAMLKSKLDGCIGLEIVFTTSHELPDTKVVFLAEYKLYVDLRNRSGHCDDGICHESGTIINLPSGECSIVPYESEDYYLGESKTQGFLPMYLDKKIVFCEIEKNKILNVRDSIGNIVKTWVDYFSEDPARSNIAEIGFGLNDKAIARGVVLEDEKSSLHIAYGRSEHLGGVTGPKAFICEDNVVHMDVVYPKDGQINVKALHIIHYNGIKELIMKDTQYVFES